MKKPLAILVPSLVFFSICSMAQLRPNAADFYQSGLMNKYDIKYMKLDITASPGSTFLAGSCEYNSVAMQPLDTFAIEFKQQMTLDSVLLNNTKIPFTRKDDHV